MKLLRADTITEMKEEKLKDLPMSRLCLPHNPSLLVPDTTFTLWLVLVKRPTNQIFCLIDEQQLRLLLGDDRFSVARVFKQSALSLPGEPLSLFRL